TLGFIFGVLRGVLIAIVITIFGIWLLGSNLPEWARNSQSLPYLQDMGDTLISMLPEGLEQQVTDIIKGGGADLTADPQVVEGGPVDASVDGTVDPTEAPLEAAPTN